MSIADKLTNIAENQQKVYEAGKQAERKAWWDDWQRNGTRTDYFNACRYWKSSSFRPEHDIRPQNASNMFAFAEMPFSLKEELEQCGRVLDTSEATDIAGIFWQSNFTETPEVKAVKCKNINNLYYRCEKLKKATLTIESAITSAVGTFYLCYSLEDLTINGTIPCSVDLKESKALTTTSVQSVIDALKDLTGLTKCTLKFHADIEAKLTDEQKATISALNWTLAFA